MNKNRQYIRGNAPPGGKFLATGLNEMIMMMMAMLTTLRWVADWCSG